MHQFNNFPVYIFLLSKKPSSQSIFERFPSKTSKTSLSSATFFANSRSSLFNFFSYINCFLISNRFLSITKFDFGNATILPVKGSAIITLTRLIVFPAIVPSISNIFLSVSTWLPFLSIVIVLSKIPVFLIFNLFFLI